LPSQPDSTASLQAHPNTTEAAKMLGVSPSTISRRDDLTGERRGERDFVLAPAEVLRLGAIYRKRSLNDVAQALLDHVQANEPGAREKVEAEIDGYFVGHSVKQEREELLRLAWRVLDPALAADIEERLGRAAPELPDQIEGWRPAAEED
jgi:hypothetical protein